MPPDIDRRTILGAASTAAWLLPAQPTSALPRAGMRGQTAITDHGAVGDGKADDHGAITRAILAARRQGGGTVVFPHAGPWLVSAPIDIDDDIILTGLTQHTVVKLVGETAEAVVRGKNKARFRIAHLTLVGTRRPGSKGNAPSAADGISLEGCSYFDIDGVRADYCRSGFRFRECFTFGTAQATALRCGSYGFALSGGCTSFTLRNTTAWGCGGGWSITGCAYGSLTGCACDLSDAGGKPGDPFGDSGGDYRRPAYVFDLSGSKGIAIIAPGCENCNSPWLYCEGTQATILNPYIFGMEAHTADWRLIQLRGATSYSNVTIVNPFGFDAVANKAGAQNAIMIENAQRQRLFLSGRWRVNAFTGGDAYPAAGIVADGERTLLDYTATSMAAGAAPFLTPHPKDQAAVLVTGMTKVLRLVGQGDGAFLLPVPGEGLYHLTARGRCSTAGGAAFGFRRTTASTPLRTWRTEAATFAIDEWVYVEPAARPEAFFTVDLRQDVQLDFDTLILTCVEGQV